MSDLYWLESSGIMQPGFSGCNALWHRKGGPDLGLFTDGFKELKKAGEPLYKTPKSIQQTIEIVKVAENGIFEVARNRFS